MVKLVFRGREFLKQINRLTTYGWFLTSTMAGITTRGHMHKCVLLVCPIQNMMVPAMSAGIVLHKALCTSRM